jgi:hypothetical protein
MLGLIDRIGRDFSGPRFRYDRLILGSIARCREDQRHAVEHLAAEMPGDMDHVLLDDERHQRRNRRFGDQQDVGARVEQQPNLGQRFLAIAHDGDALSLDAEKGRKDTHLVIRLGHDANLVIVSALLPERAPDLKQHES